MINKRNIPISGKVIFSNIVYNLIANWNQCKARLEVETGIISQLQKDIWSKTAHYSAQQERGLSLFWSTQVYYDYKWYFDIKFKSP